MGDQSRRAPPPPCSCGTPGGSRYTWLRLNTHGQVRDRRSAQCECGVHDVRCAFFFLPSSVSVCLRASLLVGLTLRLHSHGALCCGEQRGVCVQARWCVCLRNADQPDLPPHTATKRESQPGGHFEIPGAHLANPGNRRVYVSATERGKSPDASLSRVHIDHSHRRG